jgi:DNA polymerase II large subunit
MNYTKKFQDDLNRTIKFFIDSKISTYKDLRNICEIKFADTLQDKVEFLLKLKGISSRLKELKHKLSREEMVLQICQDFLDRKFGDLSKIELVQLCVRCAVCIITDGVVSAPIQGIPKIAEQSNTDGSTYVEIYYAGPIRGAGGTASALSLLVCQYMSRKLGYSKYQATPQELERYCGEILKYIKLHPVIRSPSIPQIKKIVLNCFICITGLATEIQEVDSYKYLPRVKTPKLRGGMSLIIVEGVFMRAKKILKYTKLFNLDWDWLSQMLSQQQENSKPKSSIKDLNPNQPKFLQTVSIGKPVLSRSKSKNGFRIRLSRSRNTGIGSRNLNPYTIKLLKFVNVGTQFIIQSPGKALGVAPNSSLQPCKVKIKQGSFLSVNSDQVYTKVKDQITQIVDLGEIGISLGDYIESSCKVPKHDFCFEIWKHFLKDKGLQHTYNPKEYHKTIEFSKINNLPFYPDLHPLVDYINYQEYKDLRNSLLKTNLINFNLDSKSLDLIQTLGLLYNFDNITKKYSFTHPLVVSNFFLLDKSDLDYSKYTTIQDIVNSNSNIKIDHKGLNILDCRVGRVESAVVSEVKPKIHGLYEIGSLNLPVNIVNKVLDKNLKLKAKLRARFCQVCNKVTYKPYCCSKSTKYLSGESSDQEIQIIEDPLQATSFLTKTFEFDFSQDFLQAFNNLNQSLGDYTIKVSNKTVYGIYEFQAIEKIILRAKYDISAWKDGTSRYTFSNLTLTHFRPIEIHTQIKELKHLGYTHDINGIELTDINQVLELRPQDIIVNYASLVYFYKVTKFIDQLLVKFYGSKPFYNIFSPLKLIGHYFLGQSPHTCAAVACRVIGYTKHTNVLYGHPIFHCAKRRNCDGDGDTLLLLGDTLLNFSQAFMRRGNGAKMNIPLMISKNIFLSEVDKECRNLDFYSEYPLEFYQGFDPLSIENPKILQNKKDQEINNLNMGYTTETNLIELDNDYNAYKKIHITKQKLQEQFKLCKSIRNLKNQTIVFEKVLKTHLIPDIVGNIRSYLKQNLRCGKCKTSYRAPTLNGLCRFCKTPLKLTVYPNSVKKYMPYVDMISKLYELDLFTKQKINLFKRELQEIFIQERNIQSNSLLRFKKS